MDSRNVQKYKCAIFSQLGYARKQEPKAIMIE